MFLFDADNRFRRLFFTPGILRHAHHEGNKLLAINDRPRDDLHPLKSGAAGRIHREGAQRQRPRSAMQEGSELEVPADFYDAAILI